MRLRYAFWHEGTLRLSKYITPFICIHMCGLGAPPTRDVVANPSRGSVSVVLVDTSAHLFVITVLAFHGMADIRM
jgi:hypothetical protein